MPLANGSIRPGRVPLTVQSSGRRPSSLIPPPSLILVDASYLAIDRLSLASRNLPRQPGSNFWMDRNCFRKLEVVVTLDSTCVFYLLHTSCHRAVAACTSSGDAQRRQGLLTTYYLLTGREPLLSFGRVGRTY